MFSALYHLVMLVGHLFCHQMPERSPHIFGVQFPLCWRCTGILIGTTIFLIWLFRNRRLIGFRVSLILAVLMPLDVLTAMFGLRGGNNTFRLITGILWGIFGTSLVLDLAARFVRSREARSAKPPKLVPESVEYAG